MMMAFHTSGERRALLLSIAAVALVVGIASAMLS